MAERRRKAEIEELDALLAGDGPVPVLRVPPWLAAAFARNETEHRRRTVLTGLWVGLVVFPSFIVADALLMPDVLGEALVMRFAIAVPLLLASLWLVTTGRLAGPAMEWLVVALVWLAATLTGCMIVSSHGPFAPMSFSYNNILLVFLAVVFQAGIVRCAIASALVVVTTALLAWFAPHFDFGFWFYYLSGAVVTAVPCLYASWSFEDQRKRRFLGARRDALRLDELMEQNRILEQLSVIEPLTGLGNRRGFERALEAAVQKAGEAGGTVAVAMIDIDFFKLFNDLYGHPAGDECLRRVAAAIEAADEGRNFTARLGGEEFAVILSNVDRRILALLGERLRSAVAGLGLAHEARGENGRVTISLGIGYSLFGPDMAPLAPGALVEAADAALYQAKRTGRDRVVVAAATLREAALSA